MGAAQYRGYYAALVQPKVHEFKTLMEATLVLLSTALIGSLAATSLIDNNRNEYGSIRCELTSYRPESRSNFNHSSDRTALANFAGYLEYEHQSANGATGFVQLQLRSVASQKLESGYSLSLWLDCALMKLKLRVNEGCTEVDDISLELVVPSGSSRTCSIGSPGMEFQAGRHYSCSRVRVFDCKDATTGSSPVRLVMEALEFEVGSWPDKARLNKFTYQPDGCTQNRYKPH